jgi:hypothetical protein
MPEPTLLSTANIGTTEGLIPALGAGGKLASSLLPSIALTETLSVANAAARLALTSTQAQGKIVIEADTGKSYGLVTAGNPATSGDWLQLGDKDITAADITDSTAAGRTLLTAANAAAQIEVLGAETPAGADAKIAAAQATAKTPPGVYASQIIAFQNGVGAGEIYRAPDGATAWLTPFLGNLAIAGDSITAQNTGVLVGTGNNSFRSDGYATVARRKLLGAFELTKKTSTASADGLDWDFGYGAFSAADFLNGKSSVFPMDDIAAADPDTVFVFLGSNASESASTDIIAIWDQFREDGRRVLAAEVLPRHSTAAGYDAGALAETYALNAILKAAAASRNIPFLEWAALVVEEPGGYGSLVNFPDAVHPGIVGANVLGTAFADFVSPYCGDPFAIPADGNAAWLTGNPYLTGDSSGGATGWTFPAQVTARSKITDADGTGWQRVTLTSATNAIIRQTAGTNTAVAGDIVRPVMRIRGIESGWALQNVHVRLYHGGTDAGFHSADGIKATYSEITEVLDGLFLGPEYEIPAEFSGLYTYIYSTGSGTYDFRQAGVIKVG